MKSVGKERNLSSLEGGGVQYLPGHVEPFIDHIISEYLGRPELTSAIDLGGGGFRFGLPATAHLQEVRVVDFDAEGVDPATILRRLEEVGNDTAEFRPENLDCISSDVIDYAEHDRLDYDVVVLSRVLHLFPPDATTRLIDALKTRMKREALLFVSVIVVVDRHTGQDNDFVQHTYPEVGKWFRRFKDTEDAAALRHAQNLPVCLHVFSEDYLRGMLLDEFELVEGPIWATRTVQGFVFRKVV